MKPYYHQSYFNNENFRYEQMFFIIVESDNWGSSTASSNSA